LTTKSLRDIGEGDAIILAQTLLPGLLEELDSATKAIQKSRAELAKVESLHRSTLAATARHENNVGYQNGIKHALARAAGTVGITGPNWLADLRAFTER
jgi:hypothetical protein